jgi:carbonic anhydrase
MKIRTLQTLILMIFISPTILAFSTQDKATSTIQDMIETNNEHVNNLSTQNLTAMLKKQTPSMTVLMCSDSRVQNESLSTASMNNMFLIRNIGNQLETANGSVEYGIRHLHTPVLLIMGHSGCGAIQASMADFRQESKHIRSELVSLETDPKQSVDENVLNNIHHQVSYALKKFHDLIETDKLVIVGAVYDIQNTFGDGNGRLIIVNINNKRKLEDIKNDPHLKGVQNLFLLGKD